MEAMGIEPAVVAIMLNRGWNSLASFAYSCGYMPGVGDETPFKQDVLKALLGDDYETNPNAPRLRRLFMESHTLAISDLRRRAERTDADMPVKLPVEERQVRKQKLQLRLPGIEIEGPSEPSNALVDLLAQQLESGWRPAEDNTTGPGLALYQTRPDTACPPLDTTERDNPYPCVVGVPSPVRARLLVV